MPSLPIVALTRRETFCSSHRLHGNNLSDEENKEVYGKCNNPNGHGHNYVVLVTVKGPLDQRTGMVMNMTELKKHIQKCISILDHKNLDLDIPYFKNVVSTTENLCIFIWDHLSSQMSKPELLHEVKILETEKNYVTYRGDATSNSYRRDRELTKSSGNNISSDSD